jgi:hypothetical protein
MAASSERRRIEKRLRRHFEDFLMLTRCFKTCDDENRDEKETKYRQDFECNLSSMIDREMYRRARRASRAPSIVDIQKPIIDLRIEDGSEERTGPATASPKVHDTRG